MRRGLLILVIVVVVVLTGSTNLSLRAAPLPQATATATAQVQPGWGTGALMRIKVDIAFSWLRGAASNSGRILATLKTGEYVVLNANTPIWDGTQWWWLVEWGATNGYIEQTSLDLVIAAPTPAPATPAPITPTGTATTAPAGRRRRRITPGGLPRSTGRGY